MSDASAAPRGARSQDQPNVEDLVAELEERRLASDAAALAETCMRMGQAYAARGSLRRALTTYEEALKAFEAREDRAGRVLCLKSMAGLCYREGAGNRALALYH